MTNSQKALITLLACLGGFIAGSIYYDGCGRKEPIEQTRTEPRVIQVKEVVGQVVGGPQIVTGTPLIGYVVYVEELKSTVALRADQCPLLGNGQRIVMFQKDEMKEWYTFLRLRYE